MAPAWPPDGARGTAGARGAAAAGAACALGAALAVRSLCGRRRASGATSAAACGAVAGVSRATKHRYALAASSASAGAGGGRLPALPVELLVAPPPARHAVSPPARGRGEEAVLIAYVLDPEPLLFGACALFAYAQAAYFHRSEACEEAQFWRLWVVGVGHAAELFGLDGGGFDCVRLRNVRRRDFPPYDHPALQPGRGPNGHAARWSLALADEVVPFVEGRLLGLPPAAKAGVRRCLLGASYSAVLALQACMRRPGVFQDVILGSPSVCFDPEILEEVASGAFAGETAAKGVGFALFVGEREKVGTALPGNVHDRMCEGTERLASELRGRGLTVEGVHELRGEDHSTMKLALVSQGLAWFARRSLQGQATGAGP